MWDNVNEIENLTLPEIVEQDTTTANNLYLLPTYVWFVIKYS